jgi:hypothetical protein
MSGRQSIRGGRAALACAVWLMTLGAAFAQSTSPVSHSDVRRLQDAVDQVATDVSQVRNRDVREAERLEERLADLRDEITYMRVALRRGDRVERADYEDVMRRIESVRTDARRATGSSVPASRTDQPRSTNPNEIPVGQEIDVRLQSALSSDTAQVEDRFEATTLVDLYQGDTLLVPAGSQLRGVVSSVEEAGRFDRKGRLTLSFDEITVRGRTHNIRATVVDALESEGIKGEVGKIGTAAGVGAIIGGLLGGFKGALAGILIGGGGTIVATEGKDVELPVGTVLRVRFDAPLMVR